MRSGKNVYRYYKIFKPYGMLSQFTPEAGHATLADLKIPFPKDVYPVGRLDSDTEGLLVLTNDKRVNDLLLNPQQQKSKTYWVQVEGIPDEEALYELSSGVLINLKGNLHRTKKAGARKLREPKISERNPSVNYVKHGITSWIELIITEGKNRQVRKMTSKVGHPTLRLIRYAIEKISIENMQIGDVVEMDEKDFFAQLGLKTRVDPFRKPKAE